MPHPAVLFDLDGTLADTAPDLVGALNAVLRETKRPPIPLEIGRWWVAGGSVRLIAEGFSVSDVEAKQHPARNDLLDHYGSHICELTTLFPGIAEVLDTLDASATPWGIVTNKPSVYTEALISALQLETRAATVVSGDTLPVSKPDPRPLLLACEKMEVYPSDCVYIGDDRRDMTAGRAAGMKTMAVTWGYGQPEEINTWGADFIIESPTEILVALASNP